jgi:hypothetical protein
MFMSISESHVGVMMGNEDVAAIVKRGSIALHATLGENVDRAQRGCYSRSEIVD